MAKNRVIYQSQAVYAGPDKKAKGDTGWKHETGATIDTEFAPVNQLKRVQSANYGFDITRTDVNQFGQLAAIDRIILESPTVNFDSSWYMCNFFNEDSIGLFVNPTGTLGANAATGILTDILENYAGERNYYIRIVSEGKDAVGYSASDESTANSHVVGIGNGFLSNWSCEAAVGGFPTASITVEGLNISFRTGSNSDDATGFAPWVSGADGSLNTTKQYLLPPATESGSSTSNVSVIKPGDVTLSLPDDMGGADLDTMHVQSFNCAVDLSREPLQKLGSRFAYAREIQFPITATLSVDAIVSDMETGNLADILGDSGDKDQAITVNFAVGDLGADDNDMKIIMRKAKLDSQSLSQGIGDNQTVTYNWSAQIGSSSQTGVGLFLSGNKQ